MDKMLTYSVVERKYPITLTENELITEQILWKDL